MELKKIFSRNEWIFFGLIISVGLFLRWYGLDIRPLHHDESLNAIYGRYFYNDPEISYYKYNPMLHGPLLYHILPFIYQVLGVSKFAIRFLPALLGSLFLFSPLLFRRFFNTKTIILQTLLIAISPSLIYWSRFLRHDFLVIFSFFIMLSGICFTKRYKTFFLSIGLSIHFCAKENFFITFAFLFAFLVYEALVNRFAERSLVFKFLNYCKKYLKETFIGLALAVFIFVYYYSAGFQYSQGIFDGLYRKSLFYWLNQHSISRISGPFIFQFLTLSWYDLLFMLLLLIQTVHFYKDVSKKYLTIFLSSFIPAIVGYIFFDKMIFSLLKIVLPIDLFLFFPLIIHSLIITTQHIKSHNNVLAFLGYFFFATFFTYSFVGEKVPWLSLYILLAGIPYICYYFQEKEIIQKLNNFRVHKVSLLSCTLVLILFFNLRMSIMTNFTNAGKAHEFISQVHTSSHYEQTLEKITDEMKRPYKSEAPLVLDYEANTWPLTWYFLNLPGFNFNKDAKNIKRYDYIFAESKNSNLDFELLETHNKVIIPLRHWWVPRYDKMNLYNFLNYAINHRPWNSTGQKFIGLYSKKLESFIDK